MFSEKFFNNKFKILFALLLPALALYYKSLKFDFSTLDEQWLIVQNADLLKGWSGLSTGFTKSIAGLYYRPLLIASVFLDYHFGGLAPFIYHLSNILLHLLSTFLLYRFLLLNKAAKQTAFLFALLFSVHPVMLHAVAWVPGRNDSLLCVFGLSALIFLLKFLLNGDKKVLLFHMLFFIAALLTKETAVVLPLIFAAYYFIHKKIGSKQTILPIALWVLIVGIWLFVRNRIVEVPAPDSLSFIEVIKNFVPAILLYTGKAIFPVQQSVLPLIRNASMVPGLCALAVLILLIFKPGIKDRRLATVGLFMFFIILALPVWYSASRPGGEHYEHRIYLPMAGLMLFFSQLKLNYDARLLRYVAVIIFVVFCFRTYTRMDIYKTKESFVDAGLAECEGNYLFAFQKSEILFNQKNFTGALDYCNQAIALRQDKSQLYSNRGTIRYSLGHYKSAVNDFSKAISLSPKVDYMFYLSRAVSYEKSNEIGKAVNDLFFLAKCCPGTVPPEIEKGIIGRWNTTLTELGDKIKTQPEDAEALYQRALLYFDVGREKDGLADLSKACALAPENKTYLKVYMSHFENKGNM